MISDLILPRNYTVLVIGLDGEVEGELNLDCDSDQEAANLAFGAASLFGHELVAADGRFLGWFDAIGAMRLTP